MTADIDLDRLLSAREHIDPVFLDSPLASHHSLDDVLGCSLLEKLETLNPIRSFKGRGTELLAATVLAPGEAVVCASAGNFGQGLARAAARRGHRCIIYAATTANTVKIAAMRRFGAEVILIGDDFDAAKLEARQYAAASGLRFIEDGAEPTIAEGAGTLGLELAAAAPHLDTMIVPLGNGALLAGVGAALRHAASRTQVVAVVADGAPAMKLSLEQGRPVETAHAHTIADGVAVRIPVPAALSMLEGRYDDVVSVSEAHILHAMRLILDHLGVVVEPAGALGVAAVLAEPDRFHDQAVATVLCGANLSGEIWNLLLASPVIKPGPE